MVLSEKSLNNIEIENYYSVKLRSIWNGFKQEGAPFKWLCVYFFFEYVRPQDVYPVLDILPWGLLALLATCITAMSDSTVKWVKNPGNSLLILFFLVVLLSAIFAFKPSLSFARFDIIINWLVLYFLMITVINSEKRFILFLLVFILLNFKMSQFGFRALISRGFSYSSWGVAGSPGWFRNAGDLGIEMTIFTTLTTGFVLGLRDYWTKYKKAFFYFLIVTGLFTIIATSSRGALLGIVAAGSWFIIKSRFGIKAIAGTLILGGLMYTFIPSGMMYEFEVAGKDVTSVVRLELWEFGMEVMHEYPVFGIGYENWVDFCWYRNPNGVYGTGRCPVQHNTLVQAVTETGVVGFIVYVAMIIFVLIMNARTRANAKYINNKFILFIAHGLDGGLIAYLASSFFFSVLFYPMFYVQFAMTVVLNELSKKQTSQIEVKLVNTSMQLRNTHGRIFE